MEFLRGYEEDLMRVCMQRVSDVRYLNGQLFETVDLDEVWDEVAAEYMADAVPNIVEYPSVAVAWVAYLGMAYANMWDGDWDGLRGRRDKYACVAGVRGFDMMDEYVMNEVIGIGYESEAGQRMEGVLRMLADVCVDRIRKEGVEPQSKLAFHVFARTVRVMYRIGVSMELYRLGYKLVVSR